MISSKVRVAVIRGGNSPAYDDSLKTGACILSLLRESPDIYEPLDIFVSRNNEWHFRGLPEEPHRILSRADVVWNAMHGPFGEDGQIQQLLEGLKIPFVGSGIFSSSLAHNKELSKAVYRKHLLLTPDWNLLREKDLHDDENLTHIFRNFPHPVIVKPSNGVRALGVRLAHTFQELKDAVIKTFQHSPKAIVEEYVSGAVISCTVIEGMRGEDLYVLTPVSLEVGKRRVIPTKEENKRIEEMSRTAHQHLGLRHYSSSDFILTSKGKIYILETNSLPVFHEDSLMHQSFKSTGLKPRDFAEQCINLASGNL